MVSVFSFVFVVVVGFVEFVVSLVYEILKMPAAPPVNCIVVCGIDIELDVDVVLSRF